MSAAYLKQALRPLGPYLPSMPPMLSWRQSFRVLSTSTIATVKGGADIHDVARFMGEHGFVVFDVLDVKRRPLDGASAPFDLMFVPDTSPLRADRRWARAA